MRAAPLTKLRPALLAAARGMVAHAEALALAYAHRAPQIPELRSVGYLLGAAAAARAGRALALGDRRADRYVDGGAHLTRPTPDPPTRRLADRAVALFVDHDAPSALPVFAMCAVASGARVRAFAGPRSEVSRPTIEAALGELAVAEGLSFGHAASPDAVPRDAHEELWIVGSGVEAPAMEPALRIGNRRSALVFAPYYHDARDLERLVRQCVLEAVAPALPTTRLDLCVPRGWEQRDQLVDRVQEALAAVDLDAKTPVAVHAYDAEGPSASLEGARAILDMQPTGALGVFIHPLWRERPDVERALDKLIESSGASLATVDHRPSLAWIVGAADVAKGARVRVDAPHGMAPAPGPWRARLRALHEAAPTLWSGLAHGAFARFGL